MYLFAKKNLRFYDKLREKYKKELEDNPGGFIELTKEEAKIPFTEKWPGSDHPHPNPLSMFKKHPEKIRPAGHHSVNKALLEQSETKEDAKKAEEKRAKERKELRIRELTAMKEVQLKDLAKHHGVKSDGKEKKDLIKEIYDHESKL